MENLEALRILQRELRRAAMANFRERRANDAGNDLAARIAREDGDTARRFVAILENRRVN